MTRLEHALQMSRRLEKYEFAVLFLDLDRFKVINDSLGHIFENQLLVKISNTCRRVGRLVVGPTGAPDNNQLGRLEQFPLHCVDLRSCLKVINLRLVSSCGNSSNTLG